MIQFFLNFSITCLKEKCELTEKFLIKFFWAVEWLELCFWSLPREWSPYWKQALGTDLNMPLLQSDAHWNFEGDGVLSLPYGHGLSVTSIVM